jgi:hypothetical protein
MWKAIHDGLVGAWAYVGPLIGVPIGAYISNRTKEGIGLLTIRNGNTRN